MFNAHVEQWLLPFVHHQVCGQSVWIIVAQRDREKMLAVANEMAMVRVRKGGGSSDTAALVSPTLFYSKSLFPPLSLLAKYGVRYRRVVLDAGQMLLAHGGCVHYGFSTQAGETYSFACNVLDEHWLVSGGPEFVLQFLEWVMDLSELRPEQLQHQLTLYGLDKRHVRAALNTCPPAYTCCLLKAIRTDLQAHLAWQADPTAPAPRVRYIVSSVDVRLALGNLDDALSVLHQPSVRQLYLRFYTTKADPCSHVCKCDEKEQEPQAEQVNMLVLRRLHACMERVTCLVVGSGQGADEPQQLARTRQRAAPSSSAAAAAHVPGPPMPISTTFGSVTAAPLARLLDFLTSSDISRSSLRLQAQSRFLDVGSGIGQVVLHVQLRCALSACVGIEYAPDRCDAAEKMLTQLQLQRQASSDADPQYKVSGLDARMLDERLDRVRFVRGRIEEHLDLLVDATHVFMFDCCFHPQTHTVLLPHLCTGPPRIVISCLTRRRMQLCWPKPITLSEVHRHFRLLRKMSLTLAGSVSSRTVFVYQTTS